MFSGFCQWKDIKEGLRVGQSIFYLPKKVWQPLATPVRLVFIIRFVKALQISVSLIGPKLFFYCFVRVNLLNPTISEILSLSLATGFGVFLCFTDFSSVTPHMENAALAAQLNARRWDGKGGVEDNSRGPLEHSPIPLGALFLLTSWQSI